jgi:hypothetical protein
MTSDEPVAIPPVPPIHPSHRRLNQGNNYLSVAASRNAAQFFPQNCDHFRGSQAIHCNCFLQLAEDSTTRSLFVSFAVSFAEVHGDCSCDSRKCIAIACADHWFDCNRVVHFAEVVAVAVRDLVELLQSLYTIAAGSSWLLVQAHGMFAIASAICRIPCGLILRLAEFIAIAFCEVADT